MSDIPETAVEEALQAVTESGLNAWVSTEGMRVALAAALPHLARAQPQPSESDIRDIAAWVNSLPSDADIRAEARAAALGECEAIARDEAVAMTEQRDDILDHGTLGGRKITDAQKKQFAYERHVAAETAVIIADAIAALKRGPVAEESGE